MYKFLKFDQNNIVQLKKYEISLKRISDYPQHMFWLTKKKIIILHTNVLTILNCTSMQNLIKIHGAVQIL